MKDKTYSLLVTDLVLLEGMQIANDLLGQTLSQQIYYCTSSNL